jgi:hypothetical protein
MAVHGVSAAKVAHRQRVHHHGFDVKLYSQRCIFYLSNAEL